jgi:hypothetical protein
MVASQRGFRSLSGSSNVKEVSMPVTKKRSSATSSKSKLKTNMAVKKKAGKKKKK